MIKVKILVIILTFSAAPETHFKSISVVFPSLGKLKVSPLYPSALHIILQPMKGGGGEAGNS